jgi:CDP-diacylglycerol--serine O-phosphatidyltransferase
VRHYVNPPNLLTSGNLAAGFLALLFVADERWLAAAAAVAIAAVLDTLDGLVARRLGGGGRFGSNLDSLADLVSFVIAPALMLWHHVADPVAIIGSGVCLMFVLAGGWRLARFPLVEDRRHFVGLPVPAAGLALTPFALLPLPAWLALGVAMALALLMVSAIPFPTLARLVRARPAAPGAAGSARAAPPPDGAPARQRPARGERDDEEIAAAAPARQRRRVEHRRPRRR